MWVVRVKVQANYRDAEQAVEENVQPKAIVSYQNQRIYCRIIVLGPLRHLQEDHCGRHLLRLRTTREHTKMRNKVFLSRDS